MVIMIMVDLETIYKYNIENDKKKLHTSNSILISNKIYLIHL